MYIAGGVLLTATVYKGRREAHDEVPKGNS